MVVRSNADALHGQIPEAYEALILDAFKGDHSNFVRDDELDIAWKVGLRRIGRPRSKSLSLTLLPAQIFTPILHQIDQAGKDVHVEGYKYGSR